MKQPVRISEYTGTNKDVGVSFAFLVIDILVQRSGLDTFEPVGHIKFQRTIHDERVKDENPWYGMSFNCSTDKVEYLEKMAAVASLAKSKAPEYYAQPKDILKAIDAEEYKLFNHEFYPVSSEGKNLYDVDFLGSVYTRIVADDEEQAKEIMKKKDLNKHTIGEHKVIKF